MITNALLAKAIDKDRHRHIGHRPLRPALVRYPIKNKIGRWLESIGQRLQRPAQVSSV